MVGFYKTWLYRAKMYADDEDDHYENEKHLYY